MEKLQESLFELDLVNPLEWQNIPKPIIQSILSLKNCVKVQSSFIESLNKNFGDFESRSNSRILNVQLAISENLEKIKENESQSKTALKAVEFVLKENLSNFEKKVTESLFEDRYLFHNKIEEIKDQVSLLNKRVDGIPTTSQVQTMVQSVSEKVRNKLKQDLKEDIVNPEVYAINQKFSLLDM